MKQVNVTFPAYSKFLVERLLPVFQQLRVNAENEILPFFLDRLSAGAVDVSHKLLFVLFSRNPEWVIDAVSEEFTSPEERGAAFGVLLAVIKTYAADYKEEPAVKIVEEETAK